MSCKFLVPECHELAKNVSKTKIFGRLPAAGYTKYRVNRIGGLRPPKIGGRRPSAAKNKRVGGLLWRPSAASEAKPERRGAYERVAGKPKSRTI